MHSSPNDASHQGNSAPLKRAMSTRHLVMISLGGAIGTGLFLGSGEVIAQTGPVGAIISYFLGGIIAYMVMLCLGSFSSKESEIPKMTLQYINPTFPIGR